MEIIIRHHRDPNIIAHLKALMPGVIWPSNGDDSIRYQDGAVSYAPWDFYNWNTDFNGIPRYDARTEMNLIEVLFNGKGLMKKKEAKTKEKAPDVDQSKVPTIIVTHGDAALCSRVQQVLGSVGLWLSGCGKRICTTTVDEGILVKWHGEKDTAIYGTGTKSKLTGVEYFKKNGPIKDIRILDARTQFLEIVRTYTGKSKLTAEMIMSPNLYSFIKSSPGDDMCAGFIRRDLGLSLPEDVQKNGSDAIFKWIMDNHGESKPTQPITKAPYRLSIELAYQVETSERNRRVDVVTLSGVVPNDVVETAIAEDNYSRVVDWMVEHRSELEEVDRETGGSDCIDSETVHEEFKEVSDTDEMIEGLDRIAGEME